MDFYKNRSTVFHLIIFLIFLSLNALPAQSIKIMPLGDSITKGYMGDSLPDSMTVGYRQKLWQLLTGEGFNVDLVGTLNHGYGVTPAFDYNHEGHGGWATWDVDDKITDFLNTNPPDIILLHIGTNDWATDVSHVESILDKIDAYESLHGHHIKVFAAKIINHKTHLNQVTQYNTNLENMVISRNSTASDDVELVDMENGALMDYSNDMFDNLHPNVSGYEKIAAKWFGVVKQYINDSALPVSLLSFSGSFRENKISLLWQTASEMENAGFEIERSGNDRQHFQMIATFVSDSTLKGQGNSSRGAEYSYRDSKIDADKEYYYRLIDVNYQGKRHRHSAIKVSTKNLNTISDFKILGNYPNPFNPTTTISVNSNASGRMSIKIYNSLGQIVRDMYQDHLSPGRININWDGKDKLGNNCVSGIYLAVLSNGTRRYVHKLSLVR